MFTNDDMDSVFQALAHTTRRKMIDIVRAEPRISVGALAAYFDVSRIAVMNHLAVLEKAGVRRVTGDIVADATWWRGVPQGAGWTANDLNESYGAEISAITLEDNYAELRLSPGAQVGDRCSFTLLQPQTGLVIDNRVTTVAKGGKRTIEATRVLGENVVHVFGELPAGEQDEVVSLPVPRPANWFAAALRAALAKRGIVVEGGARSAWIIK